MAWSMPGVAQAGPNATGAWTNQFGGWYSDLARQWDGSFIYQGPPNTGKDSYRGWDCTGAYLLNYAMPLKKLYITGKKESVVEKFSVSQAKDIISAGIGWTNKNRDEYYHRLDQDELYKRLSSWSPTVRERAATAVLKRTMQSGSLAEKMISLLKSNKLESQLGACAVLAKLKSAKAVPALTKCLDSPHLWLRIKAAEALAATGESAMSSLPKLLEMVSEGPSKEDPRAMQQRYLSSPIFDRMLKKSIAEVDQALLQKAIIQSLKNQDGRSRGSVSKVYKTLSYDQIKPLLPAIYEAVRTPAPSGIMFSGEVRLAGVELFAKHRIKEGMELSLVAMEIEKWGKQRRIKRCINAIGQYGSAATPMLPKLRELEKKLLKHREAKSLSSHAQLLQTVIKQIESSKETIPLRSIK